MGISAPEEPREGGLKSVATALDVLECFAVEEELGVSDIARRLGIAKSTAHRLLSTLCSRGIAERNPDTGQYRLGMHLFELGQLAKQRDHLRQTALPALFQLRQATGYTVQLSVPDGVDVIITERLETSVGLHMLMYQGRRMPSHVTSSGKAIAAYAPAFAEARIQAGFPRQTARTITTAREYQRVLEETRRLGYAVTHGEATMGVSSVASPIRGYTGDAFAAVSIVGATPVILDAVGRLTRMVSAVARKISQTPGS